MEMLFFFRVIFARLNTILEQKKKKKRSKLSETVKSCVKILYMEWFCLGDL